MKNSILFSFIFILLIISCKQKDDPKAPSNNNAIKSLTSTNTDDACFSSYQIYSETAFLWQASWVTYYNRYRSGYYDNSPRVSFDEPSLRSLYNKVKNEDHPGILLWYTLLDQNDSIPSLAIQNTVACKIDTKSPILLAYGNDPTSNVRTISQEYLDTIKGIWNDAGRLNPNVYTEINGYNYEWDSIQSLMTTNAGPQGIYVHYGLRTIGPEETDFRTPYSSKTGSVVYCNIVYGDNFEVDPSATLLDFAMPCPEYCGK